MPSRPPKPAVSKSIVPKSAVFGGANVALTGLAAALAEREQSGKPIQIGLIGCGEMGTDLMARVAHMQGIRVGAVMARRPERALEAGKIAWLEDGHISLVHNAAEMERAIRSGRAAACDNLDLVLQCPLIDIIVDATGDPEAGAEIGQKTIQNGKHLVMMNVEADVTIGPYLKHLADKAGVIYTLGAGDEPSACMELIEFVAAQGHKIIAAGKGKNNPLKVSATPREYQAEADKRNMNVRMLVEFIDGSKTMVEMAAIANATGLSIDCPGMHGPNAPLSRLNKVLIPAAEGGILRQGGAVDYSVGQGVAPGVFVVAEMRHPRIWERMEDLKIGSGPYFTFYRPFHLTAMEVPLSCARAVLWGKADMVPLPRPSAEVCAVAKRDLAAGESLDFIGLYTYRAWTLSAAEAKAKQALPCGLLKGAKVTRAITAGELITAANCAINEEQWIAKLRREQDKMLAENTLEALPIQMSKKTDGYETTGLVLDSIIAIAEHEPQNYPISTAATAEMKSERKFIRANGYKISHKIEDLEIGKGEIPLLYQNTKTEESSVINLGTDFVLALPNSPKIFLEATRCTDTERNEVLNTAKSAPPKSIFPYSPPESSLPNLTKKQSAAEVKKQSAESRNPCNGGYYGDRPEKQWAQNIVNKTILGKIGTYKKKLADKQKLSANGAQLWLLIKTDYWFDWQTPFLDTAHSKDNSFREPELLPFLQQEIEKSGLKNFSPFDRIIIMNARGFLVFDHDWKTYKIWPPTSLEW